ncbi:MAG: hypothetical protein HZA08_02130 [Nitrospirae bacterium]|nr:hypothetical protein [Nitrospirota bacterium]
MNMAIRIFIISLISLILYFPTPAYTVDFEIIRTSEVTIKYEKGLNGVSNEIVRLIPSLKQEIEKRVGLPVNFPFGVIIYMHRDTFRSLTDNDMIAAFAIPGRSLIVLDYSQFKYDSLTLRKILMHEMCHLLLHKNIAGNNLPRWFDEGVSEWVSGGINELIYPQSTDVLKRASINNTLLPFATISDSLPSDPVNLVLSYEQGRSMVEYIEKRYGIDSIKGIILRLSTGAGFHETISHESGADFTEIEKEWRKGKETQYTWLAYISDNIYLILFFIAAFLTIYGFIIFRRRMRDYKDEEI